MKTGSWGAMGSQAEAMPLGDRITLARVSELARAGLLARAWDVLRENETLLGYSPEACDLAARISFLCGDYDQARLLWQRADWLAAGAEPFHSTLASFLDYIKWRQRRRRTLRLIWLRLRRKARRIRGKVRGAMYLFSRRRKTAPLPPLDLPAPEPTSIPAPLAVTNMEQRMDEAEKAETPAPAPAIAADSIPPTPVSDMETGITAPPAVEQLSPDVSTAPAAEKDGDSDAAGGDKRG